MQNSLYLIPQLWKFNFLTEAPKYRVMTGEWKGFLIPEADDTVVIFDGQARSVKYAAVVRVRVLVLQRTYGILMNLHLDYVFGMNFSMRRRLIPMQCCVVQSLKNG